MKRLGIFSAFVLLCFSLSFGQVSVSVDSVSPLMYGNDVVITDDALPFSSLPWPENVQEVLDSLLFSSLFETSSVGLMVYDLSADSVLYFRNPRLRLRPASTLKLLTAVTALDCLGKDHLLRTRLWTDGVVDSLRVLRGNVYIEGCMDPCFGMKDLEMLTEGVVSLGIDTLCGDVCADSSMKDERMLGEGWCWDDENPVLNALLLDGKDGLIPAFVDGLRSRGIVITGETGARVKTPSGSQLLSTCYHSVGDLLERMLKQSDNLYAEALFYQIASFRTGAGATAKDAVKEERRLLERLGLPASTYRIADGSGLSLYNHLTAEMEVMLLRHAFRSPHIFPSLYASLPIAGIDGTLRDRMRGTAACGNVRAKTGSLESVSTLAGYCQAANGHWLCFAILNNGLQSKGDGRHFQNRVCMALCQKY